MGHPVPARLGWTSWLLRLHCAPDTSAKIAEALARRPDTSWITLASGGTELYCAVTARTADERDALLLRKLPHTPSVVSVQAHCLLHTFTGTPAAHPLVPRPAPGPAAPRADSDTAGLVRLTAADETLLRELAQDGRAALPQLAEATGLSASSVKRHLERLVSEGALEFTVDLAPQHFGYQMMVRLWLSVRPGKLGTVGATMAGHPEISFVAATTGPSNLVASGVFHGPRDLYHYLDHRVGTLPDVRSVETAPILREVKRLMYGIGTP
ncbi:Lrp/AsnC family transcriptional regulator [Streptomyces albireticuli]|uniref:Lrp/AsnC family transcriptional regulator n=1 Tax=Streptomyces albireticuli TaxID=1940 RepID=UPI00369ED6FF